MIFVKYLHTCLAFLKQAWSSIRHVLPVVTWPSRVAPNAAPEPQTIATGASPSVPPPEATVTAESFATALAPLLAGVMLERSSFGWPLVIAGALKVVYDLLLLARFRAVRVPGEP